MRDRIRLLIDAPADPAENMGRDQALLTLVGDGTLEPTLRLYGWSPPTISLGYFQRYAEFAALGPPLGSLRVVRRVTGGGAIVHADELTYSLTLPSDHRLAAAGTACLYDRVHAAIIETARSFGVDARRRGPCGEPDHAQRGPFLCFSRGHAADVVAGDLKLAGSAQRRTRHAVLQHGSIILRRQFDEQTSAAICEPDRPRSGSSSGAAIDPADFRNTFAKCLEFSLNTELTPASWTNDALDAAEREAIRFRDPAWTRRR